MPQAVWKYAVTEAFCNGSRAALNYMLRAALTADEIAARLIIVFQETKENPLVYGTSAVCYAASECPFVYSEMSWCFSLLSGQFVFVKRTATHTQLPMAIVNWHPCE